MEKMLSYYVVYVWEQRRLVGRGLAGHTFKTYLSRAKNFRDFLKFSGNLSLRPDQVNIRLVRSFEIFLRSEKGHCNDYVMRNIQMLKSMCELAIDDEVITINPVKKFKFRYERKM